MLNSCAPPHASVRCAAQVRVWSVPAGAVLCAATVQQDVVTRVLFGAPHGQRLVVGTLRGRARHYEFNGQVRRAWDWAPWYSRAAALRRHPARCTLHVAPCTLHPARCTRPWYRIAACVGAALHLGLLMVGKHCCEGYHGSSRSRQWLQ